MFNEKEQKYRAVVIAVIKGRKVRETLDTMAYDKWSAVSNIANAYNGYMRLGYVENYRILETYKVDEK